MKTKLNINFATVRYTKQLVDMILDEAKKNAVNFINYKDLEKLYCRNDNGFDYFIKKYPETRLRVFKIRAICEQNRINSRTEMEIFIENLQEKSGQLSIEWFVIKYNIKSKSREIEIKTLRQYLCYLIKRKTTKPLSEIGNIVGLTHATIIHAVKEIENKLSIKDAYLNSIIKKYSHDLNLISYE